MPFQPGQSGNPAGRPRGSRSRRSIVAECLLDDNVELIMQQVISKVRDGDPVVLRACLDRLTPRAKHAPIAFELPPIATPADALKAMSTIMQGIGAGELTPVEAAELSMMVRLMSQVASETDIEQRIKLQEQITALRAGKAK